jgi:cell fate regulator YaaT (PSP1 superfamily)
MSCKGCALSKPSSGKSASERCNCGSLSSSDWLADIPMSASLHSEFVEVKFKKTRKAFFRNDSKIRLHSGDMVVVESKFGYDLGMISLTGLMAARKHERKEKEQRHEVLSVLGKANQKDLDLWQTAIKREKEAIVFARKTAREMNLDMKISDVEFQGDNTKAIYYYISEGRVDFRDLIRAFAAQFKIRIEMKQIGARQEAGRAGGLGSCGRELCCSTWLTDFRTVSTTAARSQQLAMNPTKLAGQCGKLKCCLNFELDGYLDALKEFPNERMVLETKKGKARVIKMDIFKRLVWFAYESINIGSIPLTLDELNEIQELIAAGKEIESIETFAFSQEEVKQKETELEGVEKNI